MKFRPESEIRSAIAAAMAEHRAAILSALPDVEVEHIGSTAVPGAWTKGDLDLLVRVSRDQFYEAVAALRTRYEINQPENWTAEFASFKEAQSSTVGVGVQLVLFGGIDDELFREWRERLLADPELLESYNNFKLSHADATSEAYIEAKGKFIEGVIGERLGTEGRPADPRTHDAST